MCAIDCPGCDLPEGCGKPWDTEYDAPGVFGRCWRKGDLVACSTYKWKPERRREVECALRASKSRKEAAQLLGIGLGALDHAANTYGFPIAETLGTGADAPTIDAPPSPELTIDELLEQRERRFARKTRHEEARKLIGVRIKSNEPIGIVHLGDPHLDDDGTDIPCIRSHMAIVKATPGLYVATVGDTTNNWIGRLAKLYAMQSTSQSEAWMLAEWLIGEGRGKWLYLVGGNHDLWSGSGDPLKWITAQAGALYQDSEARVALRFPNGTEVRVNCRHDFAGNSQWNPAHGPMKAGLLGCRDHILIAGHKHISAYGILKDPESGTVLHSIIVAGYKVFDRFARDKGFRDQRISPSCCTVIDPRLAADHPGLVKVFWDPHEGAEYLTWLRGRQRAAA